MAAIKARSSKRPFKRWAILLLLAVIAYGIGRGCDCADPARQVGDTGTAGSLASDRSDKAAGEGAQGIAILHPPAPAAATEGTVVRVRDGDSIVVLRGGAGVEVRLDSVDAPELAQAFGKRAKSFTSGLAFGKKVRVEGKGKDRYGRELAEVRLPDGRSLNRELVAAGYAWWYRTYSKDRTLEELEQIARTTRRGLWADPKPVPPWEFRAKNPR